MSDTSKPHAIVDESLSDVVRDYRLTTQYEGNFTIHFHADPDAPPSSPRRRERWKKVRTLGHGGQGQVILETCVDGGRNLRERAVKKIRLQEDDSNRRYQRELTAIVKFSHDRYSRYFVKSLGWYKSSNSLFIAMEYLPAGDLYTYVREYGCLPENDCRQIAGQILSGIALMHAEGFAHRDVKPQNLLIHQHPQGVPPGSWWIKLADFGISKRTSTDTNTTTAFNGTPSYMAPELLSPNPVSGPTNYSRAADIWAFGITLFFILTEAVPFENQYMTIEYARNLGEPFPGDLLGHSQVSQDGQGFVRDLIRPQPEARLDSDTAMRNAWIQGGLSKTSISDIGSRPSTISSRRSSFDDMEGLTTEISTLASKPYTQGWTGKIHDIVKAQDLQDKGQDNTEMMTLGKSAENGGSQTHGQLADHEDRVSAGDRVSWKLLRTAIRTGNTELVKVLLDNGVSANITTYAGWSPLHSSAFLGHVEIIRLLHANGANLEAKYLPYHTTPLQVATQEDKELAVKLLLELGANIEAKDQNGVTPLREAVWKGYEAVAKLLLEMGADLNTLDAHYYTPLQSASKEGLIAPTKLLLDLGAKIEESYYENNPLMLAAEGGFEAVTELLLENGANIEAKDGLGGTALIEAAKNGHEAVTKLLLEKEANLEAKGWKDETALMRATRWGYRAVVMLLLDRGAELEVMNDDGQTPLIMAAMSAEWSVVELLLDKGAKIEAADTRGRTSLLYASEQGEERVVKLLLEKGADIEATDKRGKTSLILAKQEKKKAVVELLLQKGAKRSLLYQLARFSL